MSLALTHKKVQQPITDNRPTSVEWITIFLLIANTANGFFNGSVEILFLSTGVLFTFWFMKDDNSTRLNSHFWIYIAVLTILQASQTLVFHMFPLKTFMGEYLRIVFAVLAIRILGDKFFDRFIRFVYVFAVISLCFYIPCMLVKPLGPWLITHVAVHLKPPFQKAGVEDFYISTENLIIFNLGQIYFHRNSGFYWEPGTHGGFLCLALFFNLFYRKEKLTSKYNILFMVTILTTLSTTTYLALFFILIAYLRDFFLKRPWISLFPLLLIALGGFAAYKNLDFLNKKIDATIEKSHSNSPGESRIGSLLADVDLVRDNPIIGSGRNIEMKFGKNFYNISWKALHRNNGIGVLLSSYGVLFIFYFFYLNWLSFFRLLGNKVNATMLLILVLIIGFSEDYFFKAFFISMTLYCGVTFIPKGRIIATRSKKMQLGKNTIRYEYD